MGSQVITENIADLDTHIMYEFATTTEKEVRRIILSSPSKHCNLDPILTLLCKGCLGPIIPLITKIVNLSLQYNTMPDNLKKALLYPLIKQSLLDSEVFKNN